MSKEPHQVLGRGRATSLLALLGELEKAGVRGTRVVAQELNLTLEAKDGKIRST